jgi:hypothetical protein
MTNVQGVCTYLSTHFANKHSHWIVHVFNLFQLFMWQFVSCYTCIQSSSVRLSTAELKYLLLRRNTVVIFELWKFWRINEVHSTFSINSSKVAVVTYYKARLVYRIELLLFVFFVISKHFAEFTLLLRGYFISAFRSSGSIITDYTW